MVACVNSVLKGSLGGLPAAALGPGAGRVHSERAWASGASTVTMLTVWDRCSRRPSRPLAVARGRRTLREQRRRIACWMGASFALPVQVVVDGEPADAQRRGNCLQ